MARRGVDPPSHSLAPTQTRWGTCLRMFPVAVIIHGGGFGIGSAREFDWRFLADKYVRHGIVVVTIQYRLGQFGLTFLRIHLFFVTSTFNFLFL